MKDFIRCEDFIFRISIMNSLEIIKRRYDDIVEYELRVGTDYGGERLHTYDTKEKALESFNDIENQIVASNASKG